MSKMKYIQPQMDIEMCNTKYALMDLLGSGSGPEPGMPQHVPMRQDPEINIP